MAEKGRVCVTGAGGYVASWLVKLLLSNGYTVHGTVRDPHDEKNAHLMKFEKASENLQLFKVDLLDRSSVSAAIKGCDGVFHVASPVPSGSVPNPENWYCLSKTEAESEALEFAKRSGLDVVTVCPTLVLGPKLQSSTNASSLVLIKLLKEGYDEVENRSRMVVDVRDVAEALLLAYEKPEAEGRYICTAHLIKSKDMVEIVRKIYPDYNYPKKFIEGKDSDKLSSEKLQTLGWRYKALEETLVDSIESYIQAGLLD
ncbi:cinnamoyl-CoA reductase 2-like isoform X4 [Diospyros lotus]|uniref:cinnamoyl-CoA reductase 2-like isoform X4 n=1 Tax=Diospyros lotus TaxID=55363 RepID=UPI00225204E1|nr:cinnamoyl-CoA reductase 2-like isoform X4 [Diospyros lotus]